MTRLAFLAVAFASVLVLDGCQPAGEKPGATSAGAIDRTELPVREPQHPPITRWNYAEFSVYFERSLVIDSVINRVSETEKGPRPAQ